MIQQPYITKLISRTLKQVTALSGLVWNSHLEKNDPIAHCDTAEPTDIQSRNFALGSSQEQLLMEIEQQSHPAWGISLKTDSTFSLIALTLVW